MNYKETTLALLKDIHEKKVQTNVDIFLEAAQKGSAVCAFGMSRVTEHLVERLHSLFGGGHLYSYHGQ